MSWDEGKRVLEFLIFKVETQTKSLTVPMRCRMATLKDNCDQTRRVEAFLPDFIITIIDRPTNSWGESCCVMYEQRGENRSSKRRTFPTYSVLGVAFEEGNLGNFVPPANW